MKIKIERILIAGLFALLAAGTTLVIVSAQEGSGSGASQFAATLITISYVTGNLIGST